MRNILLLVEHHSNRCLLTEVLSSRYNIILPETDDVLNEPFDLCVVDGISLDRLWERIKARKQAEQPAFLPFLLVTSRQDVGMATRHLWKSIDDIIISPIEKIELQARLESLLKQRQLSLAFHQVLASASPLAVITLNKTCEITDWNPTAESIFGWRKNEVVGQPLNFLTIEGQDEKWNQICELIWRGEEVPTIESRGRKKDGSIIDVAISAAPLRDTHGITTHIVCLVSDVTERKRAEKQIQNEQLFSSTLIDCLPGSLFLIDRNGKFLRWNKNLEAVTGYSAEEIAKMCPTDFFQSQDQVTVQNAIKEALINGEAIVEVEAVSKNGSHIPHYFIGRRLVINDEPCVIGIGVDISERKRLMNALEKSERQYREFFEDDLSANYISTLEGKLLDCNTAFVKLFGFSSKEEALSYNIVALYPDKETRNDFLATLSREKKLEFHEIELLRRDGSPIHIMENVVGTFNEKGELTLIKGYLYDETKRRLAEQQLIQAQKLESLGILASGIAHDFNNILGIIMGHASLLERLKNDPEKLTYSIDVINKAAVRGSALIKQLLTFARKSETLLGIVSINDIIKEIIKLMQETFPKNIEISVELQTNLPDILVDATQIHQILLNLCINARDAMPKGGTLSITTSSIDGQSLKEKYIKAESSDYIVVKISDTGVGMSKETRERIFEPFFTTKEPGKGTGLGLSLVYSIVQNHRGFIEVDSELGKGTTFSIYLPSYSQQPTNAQSQKIDFEVIPGGKETILLVEDEEMLRTLVQTVLISKGYNVLTAQNGEEGLQLYRMHQNEIAIVITDRGLPKMNGEDLIKNIKQINTNAKIIMASGFLEPQVKTELSDIGIKYFIQKPYQIDEILKTVRDTIDSPKR